LVKNFIEYSPPLPPPILAGYVFISGFEALDRAGKRAVLLGMKMKQKNGLENSIFPFPIGKTIPYK